MRIPKWAKVLGLVILADQASEFIVDYVRDKSFDNTRQHFPEYVQNIKNVYGDIQNPESYYKRLGLTK